ncbi:hypothetical protein MNBD_GAMMA09-3306 [hydrothermal vent metagenome]|uniref:OmpA-like domain-containing protein n=1 Tax=hydrothermal vent metagenome TaxID=652676 RepID=A0A3B0YAX6_9ZZZZ
MGQEKPENTDNVGSPAKVEDACAALVSLQSKIELSLAADYARAGKYSEAEAVLYSMERDTKESAIYCDLLARIFSQQGEFLEAVKWWDRGQKASVNSVSHRNALEKIASFHRNGSRYFFFNTKFLSVIVAVLLMVYLIGLSSWINEANNLLADLSLRVTKEHKGAALAEVSKSNFQELVQERAKNINDKLESIIQHNAVSQMKLQQLEKKVNNTDDPPGVKVNIPGVMVITSNGSSRLLFEEGTFIKGVELTKKAQNILILIGELLEPYAHEITVSVVGYANNLPMPKGHRYGDNIGLGLARATTVVNFLRLEGGLPFSILSGRSSGEFNTPFPGGIQESNSKNRTVVLEIERQNKNGSTGAK